MECNTTKVQRRSILLRAKTDKEVLNGFLSGENIHVFFMAGTPEAYSSKVLHTFSFCFVKQSKIK